MLRDVAVCNFIHTWPRWNGVLRLTHYEQPLSHNRGPRYDDIFSRLHLPLSETKSGFFESTFGLAEELLLGLIQTSCLGGVDDSLAFPTLVEA